MITYFDPAVKRTLAWKRLTRAARECYRELCEASAEHGMRGRFPGYARRKHAQRELRTLTTESNRRHLEDLVTAGFARWEGDDLVLLRYLVVLEVRRELWLAQQQARVCRRRWRPVKGGREQAAARVLRLQAELLQLTQKVTPEVTPEVTASNEGLPLLESIHGSIHGSIRSGSGASQGSDLPPSEPQPPTTTTDSGRARARVRADEPESSSSSPGTLTEAGRSQLGELVTMWPPQRRGDRAAMLAAWWSATGGEVAEDVWPLLLAAIRAETVDSPRWDRWRAPLLSVVLGGPANGSKYSDDAKLPALLSAATAAAVLERERQAAAAAKRRRAETPRPAPPPVVTRSYVQSWWEVERPGEPFPGEEAAVAFMDATKPRPRAAPAAFADRDGETDPDDENEPQNANQSVLSV